MKDFCLCLNDPFINKMYQVRCDLVPPGSEEMRWVRSGALKRSCLVTLKILTGIHLLYLKCRDWENNVFSTFILVSEDKLVLL